MGSVQTQSKMYLKLMYQYDDGLEFNIALVIPTHTLHNQYIYIFLVAFVRKLICGN